MTTQNDSEHGSIDSSERKNVAFDMETLGLTAEDEITCAVFRDPGGERREPNMRVVYNRPEEASDVPPRRLEDHIEDHIEGTESVDCVDLDDHNINVSLCDSEQKMIDVIMQELNSIPTGQPSDGGFPLTPNLVGFNTENFDIPLLRSRSYKAGVEWRLNGWNSLDVMYAFQHQFNTKVQSADLDTLNKKPKRKFGEYIGADVDGDMYVSELDEAIEAEGFTDEQFIEFLNENDKDVPVSTHGSLDDIFDLLVGVDVPDPFDDSEEAVEAHQKGNIQDVALHNVVDVWQTYVLSDIAERYGNFDEITIRSL